MVGGLRYTPLRRAIYAHPTMAEGLTFLLRGTPAAPAAWLSASKPVHRTAPCGQAPTNSSISLLFSGPAQAGVTAPAVRTPVMWTLARAEPFSAARPSVHHRHGRLPCLVKRRRCPELPLASRPQGRRRRRAACATERGAGHCIPEPWPRRPVRGVLTQQWPASPQRQ
jgi:hypothetical protein